MAYNAAQSYEEFIAEHFPVPAHLSGYDTFPDAVEAGRLVGRWKCGGDDAREIELYDRGPDYRGIQLSTWRGGYEWRVVGRYHVHVTQGGVYDYDIEDPTEVGWRHTPRGWRYVNRAEK